MNDLLVIFLLLGIGLLLHLIWGRTGRAGKLLIDRQINAEMARHDLATRKAIAEMDRIDRETFHRIVMTSDERE